MWDTIDALMTEVPEAGWKTPTALPGWCVHDVVAHVIGTERMLAGCRHRTSTCRRFDHVRNPIGVLNECWVRHLSRRDRVRDVLTRFRDVTARAPRGAVGR